MSLCSLAPNVTARNYNILLSVDIIIIMIMMMMIMMMIIIIIINKT